MTDPLVPEHPHDAGVPEEHPDHSHMEGAHLLANQARAELGDQGFTYQEVLEWADTYLATVSSGDVSSFIRWIAARENSL